jgi:glutamate synthase domain-containing protein 3
MVEVEGFDEPEDLELVRDLLIEHAAVTGSAVAERLLDDWDNVQDRFVKIMPTDFRRVMDQRKKVMESIFERADDWCRVEGSNGHVDFDRFASPRELDLVRDLLERYATPRSFDRVGGVLVPHAAYAGRWDWPFTNFVKVIPDDSRRVLLERKRAAEQDRDNENALPLEVSRG